MTFAFYYFEFLNSEHFACAWMLLPPLIAIFRLSFLRIKRISIGLRLQQNLALSTDKSIDT